MRLYVLGAILLLFAISIAIAVDFDVEKVMQDARKEMIEELKEKTKDGATSRRFARKKFTEL